MIYRRECIDIQYQIHDCGFCESRTFFGRKSPCAENTALRDTGSNVQELINISDFQLAVTTYGVGSNKSKSDTSCTAEIRLRVIGHPCREDRGCSIYAWDGEVKRAIRNKFVACACVFGQQI